MDFELRLANAEDTPHLLEIVLDALPDDPFYCYLWADRHKFPNDHQDYWLRRLQADVFNPSYSFVVAESVGRRELMAFGIWERRGNDEEANSTRTQNGDVEACEFAGWDEPKWFGLLLRDWADPK
jgi:hypothetical protein